LKFRNTLTLGRPDFPGDLLSSLDLFFQSQWEEEYSGMTDDEKDSIVRVRSFHCKRIRLG